MNIVIAPDSLKGSVRAADAAEAIAAGWRRVRPYDTILVRPMADGGEGTIDAVAHAVPSAVRRPVAVRGPAEGKPPVDTEWLEYTDPAGIRVGLVELADASGLERIGEPDPLGAHTYGFGEAIAAALDAGVQRLLLAIGGSASTDGGTGALAALGAVFQGGEGLPLPLGGGALTSLARVDLAGLRALPADGALILSDVRAPLTGPTGAAAVFGPQKGASPEQAAHLDAALARLAGHLDADPAAPGAGAAGGTGFGLMAWGGRVVSGAVAVADAIALDGAIASADLVITGEGSFDGQTADGKAPSLVLDSARRHGVRAAVVAGRIEAPPGHADAVSLTELAGSAQESMAHPRAWLEEAGRVLATRFGQ